MAKEQTTLIVQHFPAPKKKYFTPTVVYPNTPTYTQPTNDQAQYEKFRAEKRGLAVEEYRRRVDVVRIAANATFVSHGDIVYPKNPADFEKYGACYVVGIIRHFDDYGTVEWREPPLIVNLRSRKDSSAALVTDTNWYQKQPPVVEETEAESC